MKNLPQISEAEYEVMKIIWAFAPISTNDVVKQLSNTDWSPKTIQTLLKRLQKKGALTYEKSGRMFVYSPAFTEKDYLNQESRSFLNRFYHGTLNQMVSNFVEHDLLSQKELSELKQLLDRKMEES